MQNIYMATDDWPSIIEYFVSRSPKSVLFITFIELDIYSHWEPISIDERNVCQFQLNEICKFYFILSLLTNYSHVSHFFYPIFHFVIPTHWHFKYIIENENVIREETEQPAHKSTDSQQYIQCMMCPYTIMHLLDTRTAHDHGFYVSYETMDDEKLDANNTRKDKPL